MSASGANDYKDRLETVFQTIYRERMIDMPLNNEKLQVEVTGLQAWQQQWIGVLITPWCMNLVLLPATDTATGWDGLRELDQINHHFPSGTYEFTTAYEAGIGYFQQCSLFSPMFEFSNQKNAVTVAKTIMLELMKADNADTETLSAAEMESIWYPTASGTDSQARSIRPDQPSPGQPSANPAKRRQQISRRDLFRGKLFDEGRCDAD